jgi:simple sugar transport system ATP-binding protein
MSEPLIRMDNVSKFYGRIQALENVSFTVNEREIVGLLGDNGAGKSTLIKVLSGAVPLTSGSIYVRGKKVEMKSTTDAIAAGIETIYQDSALVTQLSIARNLFLGREPIKGPAFLNRMDTEMMNQVARDLLKQVGISKNIPPETPIGSLSGGERQAVAIARAMHFDSDLIILDEPTVALAIKEVRRVLDFIQSIKAGGRSCIYIEHTLANVHEVADRLIVLDRGEIALDTPKSALSLSELTEFLLSLHRVRH